MPVGETIRRLREKRGLSQDQASRLAGVNRNTWPFWEQGRRNPSPQMLPAIAYALGCGIADLTSDAADLSAAWVSVATRAQKAALVEFIKGQPVNLKGRTNGNARSYNGRKG